MLPPRWGNLPPRGGKICYPQEGVSYFNIFTPNTHLLVIRLIADNFIEVYSEISSILECRSEVAQENIIFT